MTDPIALIEARIAAAVDTVRAIPGTDLGIEGGEDWPEYVLASWDEFKAGQTARRAEPTPEAFADLLVVIGWLDTLDPSEGELVWLRAAGVPWRIVSHRTGCVRPKAWSRWKAAIAKVARKAKARSKASPVAKPKPDATVKASTPAPDPDKDDDTARTLIGPVMVGAVDQGTRAVA